MKGSPGENRVIVLTGAGSGIGKHLAIALSRRGHRVVATDVNEAALSALAREEPGPRLITRALDVRKEASFEDVFDFAEDAFDALDVMLNVAGVLTPGWVHELTLASVELQIDVNVKGVIYGTRAAARRMVPRGRGHIVNFGSLASLAPAEGISVYVASKFAVRGFTLAAASELRGHGVDVTLVMPDAVKTPMLDLQASREEAALTFSGDKPLTTEDIERAIVDEVLPKRPLELALPAARAALARMANAAPETAMRLTPMLRKKGRAGQKAYRGK